MDVVPGLQVADIATCVHEVADSSRPPMRAVLLALALMLTAPLGTSAAAETEAEETERYAREAVERVVNSHDNVLIMKGGELMIKQQAVKSAHKLLVEWGKEQNLGPQWWQDRPEWIAAKAELIAAGELVLKEQFVDDAWLRRTWTEYTASNFNGEQASVIADHFETEGGIKQRRLMDWYLGETTLFYYTFTDRFDYEVKETREQLIALQKEALKRIPREDVHFSKRNPEAFAFIACSPDSQNCPGLHYWKMLTIPMMGAVFAHMEKTTRDIEACMRKQRPSIQRHIDAFQADIRSREAARR